MPRGRKRKRTSEIIIQAYHVDYHSSQSKNNKIASKLQREANFNDDFVVADIYDEPDLFCFMLN